MANHAVAVDGFDRAEMIFASYLNGVENDEHTIALVRYQDTESERCMIIDDVLVSPTLTPQDRQPMCKAVLMALGALGKANGMRVRLWTEFDP